MPQPPSDIRRKRWRRLLIAHVDDFGRQMDALRFSVGTFGEDFDSQRFAEAFSSDDPELYSRVQAIESAFGRLQNYMATMADTGTKLANLERRSPVDNELKSQPAFEALRDAGVITKDLCHRLVKTQRSRNVFEHDYVRVQADDVHEAVAQLLKIAPEFLDRFARWVAPYLTDA